jgi:hypothetical protein
MVFRSEKELRQGLRKLGVKNAKKLAKKLHRKQFEKMLPRHMVNAIAELF